MTNKLVPGSCFCGAVQFTIELPTLVLRALPLQHVPAPTWRGFRNLDCGASKSIENHSR
jgi:hypothetical protein